MTRDDVVAERESGSAWVTVGVTLLVLALGALVFRVGLPFSMPPLRQMAERSLPFLPVALGAGLLVSLSGHSLLGGSYTALILALALPWTAGPDLPGQTGGYLGPRYLELLLPHLYDPASAMEGSANLTVPALLGPSATLHPRGARLYVGLAPLLLALLGLASARGLLAWTVRLAMLPLIAILGGMLMALQEPVLRMQLQGMQVCLAILAGLGLACLANRDDEERGAGAVLGLGALAVILAGVAIGLQAWAGSVQARELVAPLVERVMAQGAPQPSPLVEMATAHHLLASLDRTAILAFGAMAALLLFLKGRGRVSAALLVLVTACDLIFGL